MDNDQPCGNTEDNWRFLPADERTRVDAPPITRAAHDGIEHTAQH